MAASDKHKRFEDEGVVFKAKLIGSELVMEPRGDKMCQNSIQRLKAIIKGTNSHKKRIVLKISYDGVKVFDEKTNEMLHHHEVSQISYIASDDTDNRTFGYVSDVPNKAHQFICFKTSGPAINVMSVISALFEAVLEKKNQTSPSSGESGADKRLQPDATTTTATSNNNNKSSITKAQDSVDLIGDSGIMEGDSMIVGGSEFDGSKLAAGQPHWSTMLENSSFASPSNSFSSTSNNINSAAGATAATAAATSDSRGKQSASTDLIFDDLFGNLSDPIIVGKNDSLISYKQQDPAQRNSSAPTDFANTKRPHPTRDNSSDYGQHQLAATPLGTSATSGGGNMRVPPPLPSSAHHPIPRRQHGHHQHGILLPPPSSLPRPSPMMMMMAQNSSSSGPAHNRSLVYNHSSVSLSDAALTRQSSFGSNSGNPQNDSYVDRYAVFNDIDNLPSIFESASLRSVNKVSGSTAPLEPLSSSIVASVAASGRSTSASDNNMFRQTNPFDDDFFA